MKRLVLVRHGKSSWKYDVADDKRPLKKRGYSDGELISGAFTRFDPSPLTIWSSPATRALETAKIFKSKLKINEEHFHIKPGLYTFHPKDLLRVIKTCPTEIKDLMVFGHNPAMTELVNSLGDRSFENIPTTGLTVIEFEVNNWENIINGKTTLHLFPKNLR